MRILLTGVTGQVGGALFDPLSTIGTVVPVRRADLDLSDPDGIPSKLRHLAPDLIINPAAYTAVDRAEEERELAYAVNARSPGIIAFWAAQHRVPLLHFSTDYVFDGSGSRPWREDDPTRPLSVYGATKLAGETAVRAAKGPHLIVRTSWVYGARGRNFLRTITQLAHERRELRIVSDQLGAPTSARTIAGAIVALLARCGSSVIDAFSRAHGIVHLACSGETSWYDFAVAVVNGLERRGVSLKVEKLTPIRSEEYPAKASRPRNSRLDLSRLYEVFGLRVPGWTDALEVELDELVADLGARF